VNEDWSAIVSHYEQCLKQHGVAPAGVDWPNGIDLAARFATQLSILDDAPAGVQTVLLDVGCGPGLLLDYLRTSGRLERVQYHGVDLSTLMVGAAHERWPDEDFQARDIVADPLPEQSVDLVVMNGVLTEKRGLTQAAMISLAEPLIAAAFRCARVAIAFNVMSRHVDWERPDLFHWGFDELGAYLSRNVSRHYTFRADYGLYEYTALVWRHPRRTAPPSAEAWWER